jgi:hypothetical protein
VFLSRRNGCWTTSKKSAREDGTGFCGFGADLYGAVGVLLVVIAVVAPAGEIDNIVSYFVTDTPIIGLNLLIAAVIALRHVYTSPASTLQ